MTPVSLLRIEDVARPYYYLRIEASVVEERILSEIRGKIRVSPDYNGEAAARFERLAFLLVKFLGHCIDAPNPMCPYLAPFIERGDAPKEAELQLDLYRYLSVAGVVDIERTGPASGRTDLYLPQDGFRFVIEVKRVLNDWGVEVLGFLGQTTAYQQTDLRLGVLAALDLTQRDAGYPHFDQCFDVCERVFSENDRRHALVVRVPGNRRPPSKAWPGTGQT